MKQSLWMFEHLCLAVVFYTAHPFRAHRLPPYSANSAIQIPESSNADQESGAVAIDPVDADHDTVDIDAVASEAIRKIEGTMTQAEIEDDVSKYIGSNTYNFGASWDGLNFDERWNRFRRVVPLRKLQNSHVSEGDPSPACHPTLLGDERSDKLIILTHGFMSCPGVWWRFIPGLLQAGFRILRPTLPGHGRKSLACQKTLRRVQNDHEADSAYGLMPDEHGNKHTCDEDPEKWEDDLSDVPRDPVSLMLFTEALGKLVEQFRAEHPNGLIVAVGHSLGGMITAKYAMERPDIVDRVLLVNPMLATSISFLEPFFKAGGAFVMDKGSSCHNKRLTGSGAGGTCQFPLALVAAMSDFAYGVMCRNWLIPGTCKVSFGLGGVLRGVAHTLLWPMLGMAGGVAVGFTVGGIPGALMGAGLGLLAAVKIGGSGIVTELYGRWFVDSRERSKETREGFGGIRQFQLVSTNWDPWIDNKAVKSFVDVVQASRAQVKPEVLDTRQYWYRCTPGDEKFIDVYARSNVKTFKTCSSFCTQDPTCIGFDFAKKNQEDACQLSRVVQGGRRNVGLADMWQHCVKEAYDVKDKLDVKQPLYEGPISCFFPAEMGHTYLSNSNKDDERWYHPYSETALLKYMVDGRPVEVVKRDDQESMCVDDEDQVTASSLAVLPAVRQIDGYNIAKRTADGVDQLEHAAVLFSGSARKQTEITGFWNDRHIEILHLTALDKVIVATRLHADDNIRDLFIVESPVETWRNKEGQACVKPTLFSVEIDEPLYNQIGGYGSSKKQWAKHFGICSSEADSSVRRLFNKAVCDHLKCKAR